VSDVMYTYHVGEAHDDLAPAFVIDSRDYADPAELAADVEAASRFLTEHRIIAEREASEPGPSRSVPTWREWREKYVVRGEPLPVRPRPRDRQAPPGLEPMSAWLEAVHAWLSDELVAVARTIAPGHAPRVDDDRGPRRVSRASVDLSEERYGLNIMMDIPAPSDDSIEAVRVAGRVLAARGWRVEAPEIGPSVVALSAQTEGHRVRVIKSYDEPDLTLVGESRPVSSGDFERGSRAV